MYSDPFEEIMLELTFSYPMRHGAETGGGKVTATGAVELAAELAAVLLAGIAAEQVVELEAEESVVGTFALVFQVLVEGVFLESE